MLEEALKTTRGNITQAANLLGATPRVISYRVRQLEIDVARF
ncbi:MAG: helix-turn-helix domain-containing protein [Planctomycetes bacterium]|nr:helix-turn-helix domain-containing protein [Planctomycetota bacterium]